MTLLRPLRLCWSLLPGLFSLPGLAAPAEAPAIPASPEAAAVAVADTGHVRAQLLSERASVAPGETFTVAVVLTSIPHWHTYWTNPGDTGLPTRITWTLPPGVVAGDIQWPLPARLPTPPLMSFGYEGATPLLVTLQTPATLQGPLVLRAKVRWLVCAEQCIPESATLSLALPVNPVPVAPAQPAPAAAPVQAAAAAALIAGWRAALPQAAAGWTVTAQQDGHWLRVAGQMPAGQQAPDRLLLFPAQKGLIAPAAPQPYQHDGDHFVLAVPLAAATGNAAATATASATPATPATPAAPAVVADLPPLAGLLVTGSQGEGRRAWTIQPVVSTVAAVQPPVDNGRVEQADAGGAAPSAASGLAGALLLAFVGGLLLNLMPCVLPVLSLKVFALMGDAGAPRSRSTLHGALFLGGVLVSFWVLAGLLLTLKAAGAAVGWGFQLQSPVFVAVLATLFAALTLNFAGVFELGTGLQAQAGDLEQSASRQGSAALGAFASGVLTTLVATPCTAPFLGAGIGFTLQQSALQAVLVFTAMALGVGLPVSLLAFFPQWLRRVPRPGPWMETLRQGFAFPMLLTVVWLCWVLGHQRGVDAMAVLLVGLALTALAAWLFGRAQRAALQGRRAMLSLTLAALALLGALGLASAVAGFADPAAAGGAVVAGQATDALAAGSASSAGGNGGAMVADGAWEPYSAQRLAALRAAGRPVFIDFTAAWCLSCQVNKRTSLHNAAVRARIRQLGVATLEADWTNSDPQITAALAVLQRNAVPVYAVYPKGGGAPVLLPEVLTPGLVLDALEQAARS